MSPTSELGGLPDLLVHNESAPVGEWSINEYATVCLGRSVGGMAIRQKISLQQACRASTTWRLGAVKRVKVRGSASIRDDVQAPA